MLSQELKAPILSLPPDDRLALIAVIVEPSKIGRLLKLAALMPFNG